MVSGDPSRPISRSTSPRLGRAASWACPPSSNMRVAPGSLSWKRSGAEKDARRDRREAPDHHALWDRGAPARGHDALGQSRRGRCKALDERVARRRGTRAGAVADEQRGADPSAWRCSPSCMAGWSPRSPSSPWNRTPSPLRERHARDRRAGSARRVRGDDGGDGRRDGHDRRPHPREARGVTNEAGAADAVADRQAGPKGLANPRGLPNPRGRLRFGVGAIIPFGGMADERWLERGARTTMAAHAHGRDARHAPPRARQAASGGLRQSSPGPTRSPSAIGNRSS